MRKKNREITDKAEIIEILEKCAVCRLVFQDDNGIHIIPMSYGYEYDDELILYFHGATEGRRAEILKNGNADVYFELDYTGEYISDVEKCSFTVKYACIVGNGMAKVIDDSEVKQIAINKILNHQVDMNIEVPEKMMNNVMVFKVAVNEFSCKKN